MVQVCVENVRPETYRKEFLKREYGGKTKKEDRDSVLKK